MVFWFVSLFFWFFFCSIAQCLFPFQVPYYSTVQVKATIIITHHISRNNTEGSTLNSTKIMWARFYKSDLSNQLCHLIVVVVVAGFIFRLIVFLLFFVCLFFFTLHHEDHMGTTVVPQSSWVPRQCPSPHGYHGSAPVLMGTTAVPQSSWAPQ